MSLPQATTILSKMPHAGSLYRVRDAALIVGLHEDTIQRRIRSGEVPAYGFPRMVALADLLKPYERKCRKK